MDPCQNAILCVTCSDNGNQSLILLLFGVHCSENSLKATNRTVQQIILQILSAIVFHHS